MLVLLPLHRSSEDRFNASPDHQVSRRRESGAGHNRSAALVTHRISGNRESSSTEASVVPLARLTAATMPPAGLQRSLDEYAGTVGGLPAGVLRDEQVRLTQFLLASEGHIEVFWAPFNHVNRGAHIALVGITPGATQMRASFEAARHALTHGASPRTAERHAKVHASFSGRMRDVLVEWLDRIGLARRLGLSSTSELWHTAAGLAHFTSVLRYPVFKDGERYGGTPNMLTTPVLRQYVDGVFLPELKLVKPDLVIGLGEVVKKTLRYAAAQGALDEKRVLFGLPHPSQGQGFEARRALFEEQRRTLQRQVRVLLP